VPLDLVAELEGLLAAFEREGIEYAVCGGIAVTIHGHVRATIDVDILVTADQVARAASVARECGFDIPARKITFGLRTNTPREVHRSSKLDPATGDLLPLDLMVVSPDLEEVWRGRVRVPWRGRTIDVVSREGLAIMKRIAGRPKDLQDIAALEGNDDDDKQD
jgi:hypothetical protein